MSDKYCPFCKSKKPMVKAGKGYTAAGGRQRWQCKSKSCRRFTTRPMDAAKV